jgi:DNA-binding NarL/FixJ family response regulator
MILPVHGSVLCADRVATVEEPTTRPDTISIVLADDHPVVRSGLRMLLEAETGFEVVAEAGDVDATARYVLGHKPTVLVLDLNMPGGSSLEAIPKMAETSPDTVVVVLTMQEDPADHAGGPCLRARGAAGGSARVRAQAGRGQRARTGDPGPPPPAAPG